MEEWISVGRERERSRKKIGMQSLCVLVCVLWETRNYGGC